MLLYFSRRNRPRDRVAAPPKLGLAVLQNVLWRAVDEDVRPYALIDAAWCPALYGRLLASELRFCNLFQGPAALANQVLPRAFLAERDRDAEGVHRGSGSGATDSLARRRPVAGPA